jgi:hypothetical protein
MRKFSGKIECGSSNHIRRIHDLNRRPMTVIRIQQKQSDIPVIDKSPSTFPKNTISRSKSLHECQ